MKIIRLLTGARHLSKKDQIAERKAAEKQARKQNPDAESVSIYALTAEGYIAEIRYPGEPRPRIVRVDW